jgi:hypothetical protein
MTTITEVAANPVTLPALSSDWFGSGGLEVTGPVDLLNAIGGAGAMGHEVSLVQAGVQRAQSGAIQDPAGSAIGSTGRPIDSGAGGGSRAIYAAFPDLEAIPAIEPRSAIFNSSDGVGKRVLHSHSPVLSGEPGDGEARRKVLEDLANTYYNAIVAFNARAQALGADGTRLNLVPVSAAIFAARFRNPTFGGSGHLDPSYTLAAISIAIATLMQSGKNIPKLSLYYYDKTVYKAAVDVFA